jgi:hypothetical protein
MVPTDYNYSYNEGKKNNRIVLKYKMGNTDSKIISPEIMSQQEELVTQKAQELEEQIENKEQLQPVEKHQSGLEEKRQTQLHRESIFPERPVFAQDPTDTLSKDKKAYYNDRVESIRSRREPILYNVHKREADLLQHNLKTRTQHCSGGNRPTYLRASPWDE